MSEPEAKPQRLVSIDALRGFDMFWILGADGLVQSLRGASDSSIIAFFAEQLDHAPWEGFHFYDLIFPLFVFLMGVSTVFSLDRIVSQHGKTAAYKRIIRRTVFLYLLSLLYHGGLSRDGGPEMFRYLGVLQRIALCYFFGSILYLNVRWRGLLVAGVTLLVAYWALMTFYPVPGFGAGDYSEGANLANYVDTHYLPGYKWDGQWDPEGLLSTVPAIVSGILGMFAGLLLVNSELDHRRRLGYLVAAGCGCLVVGWLWGLQFPIVKKLWTSSFVLFAGGWSFLLVAFFHSVIDILKFDAWARPFVWIGMNPITLYMLGSLLENGYEVLGRRMVHQPVLDATAPWGAIGVAVLGTLVPVLVAYWLYRRRIFLRL